MTMKILDEDVVYFGGAESGAPLAAGMRISDKLYFGLAVPGGGGVPTFDVLLSGVSPLTLLNAVKLNYIKAFGKCEQASTPTPDNPVDIVCNNGTIKYGKPVTLDATRYYAYISNYGTWIYSGDSYSIIIPVEVGQKYKITADTTTPINGIANIILRWGFVDNLPPETWKQTSITPSQTSKTIYDYMRSTPQDTPTVEITATHSYMIVQMGAGIFADNIANSRISVAVQEVYPDGTPEVLRVGGKNLFNVVISSNKAITGKGQIVNTSNRSATEKGVPIVGGKDYVLSYADSFNNGVFFYDANDEFISYLTWGEPPRAFTTPSDARFVRFSFYNATLPTDVQLELGSTATEYEPYFEGTSATCQPLLSVGTYKDWQNITNGAITRNVGVKVFDGTEDWTYSGSLLSYMYSLRIDDLYAEDASVTSERKTPYCTHFVRSEQWKISNAEARNNAVQAYYSRSGSSVIGLGYNYASAEGLTNFKQFLADQYNAGTPVIVVYPLATPTTETVARQTLTLEKGTNVVTAEGSVSDLELEVSYKAYAEVTVEEIEAVNTDENVEVTIG